MSSFSLTNAEQLWGFFSMLERRHIDITPYLNECLIPEQARHNADLKLTSKQNYDFLASVCRDQNLPELGWEVGRELGAGALGSLGLQTLEQVGSEALEELSHQIQFHASGAHFFVLRDGDQRRFCNIGSVPADSYGYAIGEFYGLAVMIDLVRRTQKAKMYQPTTIGVRSSDWGNVPAALESAEIKFEQRYLSIDIPKEIVKTRQGKARVRSHRAAQSIAEKLRLLLQPHLLGPAITLAEVSRITGMPRRSIQRHLAFEQTDFRSLLKEERMSLAAKQLKDSTIAIAEISERFGYAHPSHFVRAFKQVHRLTPRQYRTQND